MSTYRKKPVEVEAVRFAKPYKSVVEFCPSFKLVKQNTGTIAWGYIETLEGMMRADLGDYIIRGTEGEFLTCKPAVFAATFELVSNE